MQACYSYQLHIVSRLLTARRLLLRIRNETYAKKYIEW